ncbi:MAG: BNR/Asp-box repeat protein [Firmicutes bacterium ADurb.Bin300]|nr:MAG: BNR/Asp-box repeat protein [Firmicutes bacterium ADurb.Bin300]
MKKSYNIPTYDISERTDLQTLVDYEKGIYLGHVTTVLLEDDKTILAVYPKGHGCGQIVLKKSFDGGKTWSQRLPVPKSFTTSMEVPTIYRTVDKEGKKRLILFSGLYPIRMSVSEDDGNTWSELEPIGDYGGIVAMADIEQTAPGEYIALFHDDGRFFTRHTFCKTSVYATGEGANRRTKYLHAYSLNGGKSYGKPKKNWLDISEGENDNWKLVYESFRGKVNPFRAFKLYQVKSVDGGLTWSKPKIIAAPKNGACICEPAVIRSPDGKKLAVLLREDSRKFNSFLITSDDNGETWSELKELPASLTGDRHTSKYLPDGRLFISFRDTTRVSPTKGDWVAWVGTFDDIINGREGEYRLRIMKDHGGKGDCTYPGVEVQKDGTIITTTYGHFSKEHLDAYIMSVSFKENDIDKTKPIKTRS